MQKYTVFCEEGLASEIDHLAHEYGLTQEDVVRQLLSAGIDSLDGLD